MRFKKHVCSSESNCILCKEYVNSLDKERRNNKGGRFRNSIESTVVRSKIKSNPQASMGKRKHQFTFELPKPSLVRPLINLS